MRSTFAPAAGLGAALAGFFDGIVFHQVLQWHHLVCLEALCVTRSVETLERQNFLDGLFHAALWVVLVAALALLVRAVAAGAELVARRFWGAVLLGAGGFNLVEGVVDHHLLGIHHVRFGPGQPAWDLAFLAFGATLAALGLWLLRARRGASAAAMPAPAR